MWILQCILFLIIIILINCSTNDIQSTTDQSIADRIGAQVADEIRKIEKELKTDEKQLTIDREKLKEGKQITKYIDDMDVIQLNVGGEIILTTRQTLTKISKSTLSLMFNGRWEHKLQIDQNGNIFFDLNPIIFRHLLDQLQIVDPNHLIHFYPPSQSSLIEPFKKMLSKLGLNQLSSLEKKNIITFNVGGQIITNRYETFTNVSNSTFDTIVPPSKIINFNNQSDVFLDYNPKVFQHLIKQLRKESFNYIDYTELSSNDERISFNLMRIDLSIYECGDLLSARHQAILSTFTEKPYPKWKLIYKATRDGFGGADFHRLCDGQQQTMTIIQSTNGYLFGGYANAAWQSSSSYTNDPRSFIFTLTNPHSILPTRYLIKGSYEQYAFYNGPAYGPTFGGGHDIYVSDKSNTTDCYTNFPHSYTDTTQKGTATFTGNYTFRTAEIEVYKLLE